MPKKFREIEKDCENCGRKLRLNNTRDIERKKFCSRRCCSLFYLNHRVLGHYIPHSENTKTQMSISAIGKHEGEKNGRFKQGQRIYRKLALNHFGHKCRLCGKEEKVCVHHIDGNRLNNKLNNLMVVCYDCHWAIHHKKVNPLVG